MPGYAQFFMKNIFNEIFISYKAIVMFTILLKIEYYKSIVAKIRIYETNYFPKNCPTNKTSHRIATS